MADILNIIRTLPGFNGSSGCKESQILDAEKTLNLHFAPDYRLYLEKIGLACIGSRELTGLTKQARLDVVTVTQDERLRTPEIQSNLYVVEQANIDGIVIWQNETGEIFQTMPGCSTRKLCNSLLEFLQNY